MSIWQSFVVWLLRKQKCFEHQRNMIKLEDKCKCAWVSKCCRNLNWDNFLWKNAYANIGWQFASVSEKSSGPFSSFCNKRRNKDTSLYSLNETSFQTIGCTWRTRSQKTKCFSSAGKVMWRKMNYPYWLFKRKENYTEKRLRMLRIASLGLYIFSKLKAFLAEMSRIEPYYRK